MCQEEGPEWMSMFSGSAVLLQCKVRVHKALPQVQARPCFHSSPGRQLWLLLPLSLCLVAAHLLEAPALLLLREQHWRPLPLPDPLDWLQHSEEWSQQFLLGLHGYEPLARAEDRHCKVRVKL